MAQQQWQAIVSHLTDSLAACGLTILHPFPIQLLNSASPSENQLPTFGRSNTLAVVIGNTNQLWQPFLHHLAQQQDVQALQDPLDSYVEQCVTSAVQRCCCCSSVCQPPNPQSAHSTSSMQQIQHQQTRHQQQASSSAISHELRFSHQTGPKFVNMLRAAQLSGLAYYSSTTHLCMHPLYGPWFALRAVAVFDCPGPDPSSYSQVPCPHPDLEAAAAAAMARLEQLGGLTNWQQHWREWANLRSIGGKYTDPRYCYSADQLEYHYTKSLELLARAVNKLQRQEQLQQDQQQQDQQQEGQQHQQQKQQQQQQQEHCN